MQGQLLTSLKVCNMHSGYATAVSCTQAPHAVQSCSKTGLYGLRTFSAIFGPEMASEAIPGHLIFKFYLGGGMPPDPPGPQLVRAYATGLVAPYSDFRPWCEHTSVPSFVYKSVHYNCHTGIYLLVSYMHEVAVKVPAVVAVKAV